jgi:DNA modification methylase
LSEHKLILGDCLDELPKIFDKSVDLVLTDPPYGTTACKWDSIIPFEPMWKNYKRIIKIMSNSLFGSDHLVVFKNE